MMTRPVAEKIAGQFDLGSVTPVGKPLLDGASRALTTTRLRAPKLVDVWGRIKETPHGRALRGWGESLLLAAPLPLTAGAGCFIGSINGDASAPLFGLILGAAAGGYAAAMQSNGDSSLLRTLERAGDPNPLRSSFVNVLAYTTAPATIAGVAAAVVQDAGRGLIAATMAGLLGGLLGLRAHQERLKDHPPADDSQSASGSTGVS